jgi:hypothetical protein
MSTLKRNLISFEKVILEKYPETQDSIEVFKEELFEKYPEWRADFPKKNDFKGVKKRLVKRSIPVLIKHRRSH